MRVFLPVLALFFAIVAALAGDALPKVDGLVVDGNEWPLRKPVPFSAQKIQFRFGEPATSPNACRVRYRLDGHDDRWHEGPGEMFVTIRFFDQNGDHVGQKTFSAMEQSPGWNTNLERSKFTYRREVLEA